MRLVLVGLLAWILSPIDLIPEFIPVSGLSTMWWSPWSPLRYVRRRVGIEDLRRRWCGSDHGFALLLRVIGSA